MRKCMNSLPEYCYQVVSVRFDCFSPPSFLPPSSSPPSSSLFPSSSFFPSSSLFPSSLFLPSAEDSFHKQVEWLQTKLVEMDQYDSDLVQHSRVKAQVHTTFSCHLLANFDEF